MAPEQIAVDALRTYLLAKVPAKLDALNADREAVLKSAYIERFNIPSNAVLKVSSSRAGAPTVVALPSGAAVQALAVVDAINAEAPPGLVASRDDDGRVQLTATALPAAGAPSVVSVRADTTGANGAFGWSAGGEHVLRVDVRAPNWRNFIDGSWPAKIPESNDRGFVIALTNRDTRPWPSAPNLRRDEWLTTFTAEVLFPHQSDLPNADREALTTCAQAVRQVILTTEGRQLGRAGKGDVMLADVSSVRIAPVSFKTPEGLRFDVALFTITVRVFQRPD